MQRSLFRITIITVSIQEVMARAVLGPSEKAALPRAKWKPSLGG